MPPTGWPTPIPRAGSKTFTPAARCFRKSNRTRRTAPAMKIWRKPSPPRTHPSMVACAWIFAIMSSRIPSMKRPRTSRIPSRTGSPREPVAATGQYRGGWRLQAEEVQADIFAGSRLRHGRIRRVVRRAGYHADDVQRYAGQPSDLRGHKSADRSAQFGLHPRLQLSARADRLGRDGLPHLAAVAGLRAPHVLPLPAVRREPDGELPVR